MAYGMTPKRWRQVKDRQPVARMRKPMPRSKRFRHVHGEPAARHTWQGRTVVWHTTQTHPAILKRKRRARRRARQATRRAQRA